MSAIDKKAERLLARARSLLREVERDLSRGRLAPDVLPGIYATLAETLEREAVEREAERGDGAGLRAQAPEVRAKAAHWGEAVTAAGCKLLHDGRWSVEAELDARIAARLEAAPAPVPVPAPTLEEEE